MWCDIYLIVFSGRQDYSEFYAIPQGKGMSVQEILNIENAHKAVYSYSGQVLKFELLDEMLVPDDKVGVILVRHNIKEIIEGNKHD